MANNFKVKTKAGGAVAANTAMTIYTCGTGIQTTIIGLTIANITNTQTFVDVQLENSDGDNVYLIKAAPLGVGSAFVPVGGDQKVVLEAGDVLKVTSSIANAVDCTLSILEID